MSRQLVMALFPGAALYFYDEQGRPKTVCSDAAMTAPLAQPVLADSNGLLPDIYVEGEFQLGFAAQRNNTDYKPMREAPCDGTEFDVLCRSHDNVEVVVKGIKYAHAPMDRTKMILWGAKNFLSPYLEPLGWKPKSDA